VKKISLTKGLIAVVGDEDFDYLSQFKWYSVGHDGKEYAARYGGRNKGLAQHIRMHRVVLNAPNGTEVDHVNRDRLDNRKLNLRLATRSQNGSNRDKFAGRTHSAFKGVTYHKRDRCWQATICVNGDYIHLGYFNTERGAALAYNNAAVKYHGEFAKLNEL
jgi:hypothetical protein